MTCRWVTDSRLTTFGRRMIITSAVFGLTTIGGAGGALAATSDTVGKSPATEVVSKAPMAVSVTFKDSLRSSGAVLRVISPDGTDVGTGKITTSQKTLRRALQRGAPQGQYVVEWKAVSARGQKMTGTFRFFAARGNGDEQTSPVPSPPSAPVATESIPSAEVVEPDRPLPAVPPAATLTPSSPSSSPSSPDASEPVAGESFPPGPTGGPDSSDPAGTPSWLAGSEPIWTTQPAPTDGSVVAGGSSSSGSDSGVSTGLTAVPLAVGGLLVLAAGMVSLVNRPRLRD